jgi:hypothetical protein
VLHVEIAPGLTVRMARAAIAGIVETEEEDEPETPETDPDEPGIRPESRYPEDPVDGTS